MVLLEEFPKIVPVNDGYPGVIGLFKNFRRPYLCFWIPFYFISFNGSSFFLQIIDFLLPACPPEITSGQRFRIGIFFQTFGNKKILPEVAAVLSETHRS